jgi:lactoylglutathione lyase
MARIRKLLHTRYRVNDMEMTVKFYRDVLGLQETNRHKSPRGSELVFMKAPASDKEIELCCYPASGPVQVQPDLTHLAFEVDDLEKFPCQLEKKGVKLTDGPTRSSSGSVFAFIDAPERLRNRTHPAGQAMNRGRSRAGVSPVATRTCGRDARTTME